jgi:hypothetical protein
MNFTFFFLIQKKKTSNRNFNFKFIDVFALVIGIHVGVTAWNKVSLVSMLMLLWSTSQTTSKVVSLPRCRKGDWCWLSLFVGWLRLAPKIHQHKIWPIELDATFTRFVQDMCSNLIRLRTFDESATCMVEPEGDEY